MRVSWKYLNENIINGQLNPLCKMSRSRVNEERYMKFKNQRVLSLHIKEKYLKNRKFIIKPNAFPYEVRKGIIHYVMFSVEPLDSAFIDTILSVYFQIPKERMLWYINAPHLRSIPDLWHCQIFIKIKMLESQIK